MSSFLEKLKMGTQAQDREAKADETNQDSEGQIFGRDLPQSRPAVFAAYKAKAAPMRKGIPSLDDKKDSGENSDKKIITSDNIDEMTAAKQGLAESKTKKKPSAKKTKKTNMANKKTDAQNQADSEWLNNEGQLAVNVYQTQDDLVLQAAIAGVKADEIEVVIEDDMVVVKGNRINPLQETGDYFIEECYWGQFSRKVILPVEVDSGRADATMKDGVLAIRIPKIQREKKKKLTIKE